METIASSPPAILPETERLAYLIQESADLLGLDCSSIYRLIQRGKLAPLAHFVGSFSFRGPELLRLLKS